jgi:1-acyl-sn-glycerol-3-phosphate acyltransferase
MLRVLGVRLRAQVYELPERALIVSNHISWLDIFVINATTQTNFVCKDDIRAWPYIGWLVAATGTVFIARSNRADAARTARTLVERLQSGERIVFFPEGTTTNGTFLLPFSAALFEAASPADARVVPMTLRYLDLQGQTSLAAAYDGDISFMECLRAIVRAPAVVADLQALPAIPSGLQRREYAARTREQIADRLGMD